MRRMHLIGVVLGLLALGACSTEQMVGTGAGGAAGSLSEGRPEQRSVVSTGDHIPQVVEANDGVITAASQTSLAGPYYHRVACTHFGALIADPVIKLAGDFLFQNSSTSEASVSLELVI